jgi:hypothetical protein
VEATSQRLWHGTADPRAWCTLGDSALQPNSRAFQVDVGVVAPSAAAPSGGTREAPAAKLEAGAAAGALTAPEPVTAPTGPGLVLSALSFFLGGGGGLGCRVWGREQAPGGTCARKPRAWRAAKQHTCGGPFWEASPVCLMGAEQNEISRTVTEWEVASPVCLMGAEQNEISRTVTEWEVPTGWHHCARCMRFASKAPTTPDACAHTVLA